MSTRIAVLATALVAAGLFVAPAAFAAVSTVTIDDSGSLTATAATVSGTYRCDPQGARRTVFVSTSIAQHSRSQTIGTGTVAVCDGQPHAYTASRSFTESPFVNGPVTATSVLLSLPVTGFPLPTFLAVTSRELTWTL